MLKCVNLLICLSVFILSDATSSKYCERPGTCPPSSLPCDLPLPLLHLSMPSCSCDVNCQPNYKCCKTSCYPHKTCQPANPITVPNDNALETNVKESPLNEIDDNIKIIFKQVQDSVTSDKELKQLSNYQENVVQGQHSTERPREVKINVFFNIIKKIYVQNLNVYNGGNKTTDGCNQTKIEKETDIIEDHSTYEIKDPENEGCLDDEDCQISEGSGYILEGSGSSPKEPINAITSEGSKYTTTENPSTNNVYETKHPENEGCLDDEDCQTTEGSGFILEGSGSSSKEPVNTIITEGLEYTTTENPSTNNVYETKHRENQGCLDDEDCQTTEGSGFILEGSGFYNEGSGLNPDDPQPHKFSFDNDQHESNNFIEQFPQIELPKVSTVPTKYKTLDGTHYIFFDEEVNEVVNGSEVHIDIEKIELN